MRTTNVLILITILFPVVFILISTLYKFVECMSDLVFLLLVTNLITIYIITFISAIVIDCKKTLTKHNRGI